MTTKTTLITRNIIQTKLKCNTYKISTIYQKLQYSAKRKYILITSKIIPTKVALISTEPVTTQQKLKYGTKIKMVKCKMIQKKTLC